MCFLLHTVFLALLCIPILGTELRSGRDLLKQNNIIQLQLFLCVLRRHICGFKQLQANNTFKILSELSMNDFCFSLISKLPMWHFQYTRDYKLCRDYFKYVNYL